MKKDKFRKALQVNIGKLSLSTPIIYASGTFGFGFELRDIVDYRYIGAFVTKTITLYPKKGNLPPRIIEVDCGVLNSIGLENPGLDTFLKEELPQIKKLKIPFIVSVGGETIEEYVEVVKRLTNVKSIRAVEVNLSCPNLKTKKMISQSRKLTYKVTKCIRDVFGGTLIVKLTPEVEDITKIAYSAYSAGCDALSLVNTFLGTAIDIETQKFYLGEKYGGYSGRGIKPQSLYRVLKVAKNIHLPIIGGGGIFDYKDAIEFFLVGATAVSLGTVVLSNPNVAKDITEGIVEYMRKKRIKNILDIVGKLKDVA